MNFSVATVTLKSMAPYSQSKMHTAPALEGESKHDFEMRTWLSKAHLSPKGTMVIPAMSIKSALADAAKYSKTQIPGQGKATWTAKFKSGIMITEDPDTGIVLGENDYADVWCDAQGNTGTMASTRVLRRFPIVPSFEVTFDIWILDPIIKQEVLTDMLNTAGMFVGIGRWRPSMSGGMYGRFQVEKMAWKDNRKMAA